MPIPALLTAALPYIGTAVSSAIGTKLGSLGSSGGGGGGGSSSGGGGGSFWGGNPAQVQQLRRYDPQQQSTLHALLTRGLSGLDNPQKGFEPIAANVRRQFNTVGVPGLAERFTSMGGSGQRSSAFAGALGSAQSELESSLAALGSQYGLQQQDILLRMLGLGTQPSFNSIYIPRTEGFGEQFGSSVAGAAGKALPGIIGLILEALKGKRIGGSNFSSSGSSFGGGGGSGF
jgi:hypothetical protein